MEKIKHKLLFFMLWLKNKPIAGSIFFSALTFFLLGSITFFNSGIYYIDDHFFSFKLALLMREQGLDAVKNFDWIYLTKMVSEHQGFSASLFQYLLIPFTFFHDHVFGLKVSDTFWASAAVGVLYYAFRKSGIRCASLFVLFLMANFFFMSRLDSGRSFVLIASLVFLEIYLAVKQKYFKLFLVFLLHVLWHESTFFMPILIAIIVEVARYLESYRSQWRTLAAGFAAPLVGGFFYPEFFKSISSLFKAIWEVSGGAAQQMGRIQGSEIYPMDIFRLLANSELFLLSLFFSMAVVFYLYVQNKKNNSSKESDELNIFVYAGFMFALFTFAGTIVISGRLQDFYFPSVIFLLGLVVTKLLNSGMVIAEKGFAKYAAIAIFVFLLVAVTNTFLNMQQVMAKNEISIVGNAATWIGEHSKEKDLVFLTNWSDFPLAFFHNSKNVYTMGAEPRLLLEYNPQLYWKWYNIFVHSFYCEEPRDCKDERQKYADDFKNADEQTQNNMKKENAEKIIQSIKNDFHAKFILTTGAMNDVIPLGNDLIEDSFVSKSEYSGGVAKAFEIK